MMMMLMVMVMMMMMMIMAMVMMMMMMMAMVMMMMILIAIKIMDIEYFWRISLNTMQIKVSSAMIYDFNQLVCICVNAVCSCLGWFYDGAAATPHLYRNTKNK